MRKFSVVLLMVAAVFLSVIPVSASTATGGEVITPFGAGEWDYMGYDRIQGIFTDNYNGRVVKSGGGDYRICNLTANRTAAISLYEVDGSTRDEVKGHGYPYSTYIDSGKCKVWNVSGYTDGSNGKAELQIDNNKEYTYLFSLWD